jgi:hydroxypyruvate isomerase
MGLGGTGPGVSTTDNPGQASDVDPIDREAATIDARSDDAREQIAELVEHAEALGRDVEDSPIAPADEAPTEETADDPAVTGEIDGD